MPGGSLGSIADQSPVIDGFMVIVVVKRPKNGVNRTLDTFTSTGASPAFHFQLCNLKSAWHDGSLIELNCEIPEDENGWYNS